MDGIDRARQPDKTKRHQARREWAKYRALDGNSNFYHLAAADHPDMVEGFLLAFRKPEDLRFLKHECWKALPMVAQKGDLRTADLLLRERPIFRPADPDAKHGGMAWREYPNLALRAAAQSGRETIAVLAMDYGADIAAPDEKTGKNAVQMADDAGFSRLADLMIARARAATEAKANPDGFSHAI